MQGGPWRAAGRGGPQYRCPRVRSCPSSQCGACALLEGPPCGSLRRRLGRDPCLAVMVAGNDCETFWDKDQLTDSCYQFNFQSTLSWREAWASCEQQGADLLSITEIHEQTYINGEGQAAPGPGRMGQGPPRGQGSRSPRPAPACGVRMPLWG